MDMLVPNICQLKIIYYIQWWVPNEWPKHLHAIENKKQMSGSKCVNQMLGDCHSQGTEQKQMKGTRRMIIKI